MTSVMIFLKVFFRLYLEASELKTYLDDWVFEKLSLNSPKNLDTARSKTFLKYKSLSLGIALDISKLWEC